MFSSLQTQVLSPSPTTSSPPSSRWPVPTPPSSRWPVPNPAKRSPTTDSWRGAPPSSSSRWPVPDRQETKLQPDTSARFKELAQSLRDEIEAEQSQANDARDEKFATPPSTSLSPKALALGAKLSSSQPPPAQVEQDNRNSMFPALSCGPPAPKTHSVESKFSLRPAKKTSSPSPVPLKLVHPAAKSFAPVDHSPAAPGLARQAKSSEYYKYSNIPWIQLLGFQREESESESSEM